MKRTHFYLCVAISFILMYCSILLLESKIGKIPHAGLSAVNATITRISANATVTRIFTDSVVANNSFEQR